MIFSFQVIDHFDYTRTVFFSFCNAIKIQNLINCNRQASVSQTLLHTYHEVFLIRFILVFFKSCELKNGSSDTFSFNLGTPQSRRFEMRQNPIQNNRFVFTMVLDNTNHSHDGSMRRSLAMLECGSNEQIELNYFGNLSNRKDSDNYFLYVNFLYFFFIIFFFILSYYFNFNSTWHLEEKHFVPLTISQSRQLIQQQHLRVELFHADGKLKMPFSSELPVSPLDWLSV